MVFSAFAWLVSGRLSVMSALLPVVNVAVAIMPGDLYVSLLGFATGNYLGVWMWLAGAERHRRATDATSRSAGP
jgi:hypothetical protein